MTELHYYWRRLGSYVWRTPEPVTRSIIAINLLAFLSRFIVADVAQAGDPFRWLAFETPAVLVKPWSLLTYPLIPADIISLLLSCYWLWIVGGMLERSWTSRRFLPYVAGITLITSVSLAVGNLLLSAIGTVPPVGMNGLWMPLAALTVSWCLLNPDQIVLMGFVLPIKGRYLMWGVVALTYFIFAGFGGPWLALFALAGIGSAYLYTKDRDRWASARQRRPKSGRPNAFQHSLDWLLYYYERMRRRGPGR